jgi:hypothetical protein
MNAGYCVRVSTGVASGVTSCAGARVAAHTINTNANALRNLVTMVVSYPLG